MGDKDMEAASFPSEDTHGHSIRQKIADISQQPAAAPGQERLRLGDAVRVSGDIVSAYLKGNISEEETFKHLRNVDEAMDIDPEAETVDVRHDDITF